jgi:hypothetical protein
VLASNSATRIVAKFKLLRRVLKRWALGLSKLKMQIKQCNEVLLVLDKLEQNRTLYSQEKSFKNVLKTHILRLLQFQKQYWHQRYIVRWTKLRDESMKFFHTAATERYRLNNITSIDTKEGHTLTNYVEKAAHIWGEFRNMLSCSIKTQMQFNLQDLVQEQDLQQMEAPFTQEGIDRIIKTMPTDKAPGPDDFNGLFFKKFWHIIKEDVYKLCQDFFNGVVDL